MKKLFVSIVVALMMTGTAYAGFSYPRIGFLYSTKDAGSLVYECQNKGDLLECNFIQTQIFKNLMPENVENERKKIKNQYKVFKKNLSKEDCEEAQEAVDILDGKKKAKNENAFKGISELEKEDIRKYVTAMRDFCVDSTELNYNNLVNLLIDRKLKTCNVGTSTFKQTFKMKIDQFTGKTTWVAVSEPEGDCGFVQLSRFEIDETKGEMVFWKYYARKAITNPKAKTLWGIQCSGFDEAEYEYDWKGLGQYMDRYMGCEIIEFSPL